MIALDRLERGTGMRVTRETSARLMLQCASLVPQESAERFRRAADWCRVGLRGVTDEGAGVTSVAPAGFSASPDLGAGRLWGDWVVIAILARASHAALARQRLRGDVAAPLEVARASAVFRASCEPAPALPMRPAGSGSPARRRRRRRVKLFSAATEIALLLVGDAEPVVADAEARLGDGVLQRAIPASIGPPSTCAQPRLPHAR